MKKSKPQLRTTSISADARDSKVAAGLRRGALLVAALLGSAGCAGAGNPVVGGTNDHLGMGTGVTSYSVAADMNGLVQGGLQGTAMGDINHDGALDLVAVDGYGAFTSFLGNGSGAVVSGGMAALFETGISSPNTLVPIFQFVPNTGSFTMADFNGDGILDVAAGDYADGNHRIEVAYGDCAGRFNNFQMFPISNGASLSMIAADMDADGDQDIVLTVGNYSFGTNHKVEIAFNDGAGNFPGTSNYVFTPSVTAYPYQLAAMDENHDGRMDLILSPQKYSNSLIIAEFPSTGVPSTSNPATQTTVAGMGPSSYAASGLGRITVADMNGDGVDDVVVGEGALSQFQILPGQSSGGFGSMLPSPTSGFAYTFPALTGVAAGTHGGGLTVGDFDADGMKDVAFIVNSASIPSGSGYQNLVNIMYQTSSGGTLSFGGPSATIPLGTPVRTANLLTGDINGDGTDDIAISSWWSGGDVPMEHFGTALGIRSVTATTPAPTSTKTIFATSQRFQGGQLCGLKGADVLCQRAAQSAGLTGSFKAFLSDTATSAATRLNHATVPYELVDGTVVASDFTGLTSGTLSHAINLDENGAASAPGTVTEDFQLAASALDVNVWTGSYTNGTSQIEGPGLEAALNSTCRDWTTNTGTAGRLAASVGSTAGVSFGTVGGTLGMPTFTPGWTGSAFTHCDQEMSLYCVQQ